MIILEISTLTCKFLSCSVKFCQFRHSWAISRKVIILDNTRHFQSILRAYGTKQTFNVIRNSNNNPLVHFSCLSLLTVYRIAHLLDLFVAHNLCINFCDIKISIALIFENTLIRNIFYFVNIVQGFFKDSINN